MVVVAEEGENLNSAPATMRKREGGTLPAARFPFRFRKFHPFFGRKRYENRRHLIPKRRGEWGEGFFFFLEKYADHFCEEKGERAVCKRALFE